jgi:hypothetical protein
MKCPLQPLHEARIIVAGQRGVQPSPEDPSSPDQPWLRWERPDSQGFFGDIWPSGPSCDASLDQQAMTSVGVAPVETKGTSGWAVPSAGVIGDGYRVNAVQLLVPQSQKLLHLSGVFDTAPPSSAPWLAPSGARWTTTWQANAWSPIELGAPATWVSLCALPDDPVASLAALVRVGSSGGTSDSMLELAFERDSASWVILGPVTVAGEPLSGIAGNPVLFQSSFAQQESLELLVPIGDSIIHCYRDLAAGGWKKRSAGISFAPAPSGQSPSGPAAPEPVAPYAISCFQGNYGAPANLEAVVGLGAIATGTIGSLVAFYFDSWKGAWNEIGPIVPADGALTGISGVPAMFQSKIGRQGDFELLVPAGNLVVHLHRDNDGGMVWKRRGNGVVYEGGTVGGHGGPMMLAATPVAVAAYQSIDGVAGSPNLEAIVRLQPPIVEQSAGQSFEVRWFDPARQSWGSAGPVALGGATLEV